jgi:regulator of protease activity HflC (stomatin/prohibitin superfamily)
MADNNNGAIEAVRGIVSGAIGFTKQVVGLILSRSELQEEGRAQVEKASHQLDAARAEGEAETARAKAKAQETRQKTAANSKS